MSIDFRLDVEKAIAQSNTEILSGSSITFASASYITGESGSVINLYSPILIPVASASAMPTPYEGTGSLYVKGADNKLYFKNDGGDEYDLTIGSTPGGELTASNIMIDGSTSGSINFVNDGVIYIKDNDAGSFVISEATNVYMNFNTTNSSETIAFYKNVRIRDDVKLTFGNGDDAHIEYDENGSDALVISGSSNLQSLNLSGSAISASCETFTLVSTDAGDLAGPTLQFIRDSASPAASDVMGKIAFRGRDAGGNSHLYAAIQSEINDVTGGGEDGVLIFNILKNANLKSALELKNNEAVFNNNGQDIDFRIETDDETHFVFIDSNANRMSIGDSTDAPAATLEITNHATAGAYGVPLLQLNSNDTNEYAVDINAANIDETVIHVTADALTDSFVMDVTADALTDGGILNLVSNSSDTSDRTLVTVKNDNTAAVGTVVMHLINDAIGGSGDPVLLIESTADETSAILELRNSNASVSGEPILRFNRSDTSAEADDMHLGAIDFRGSDSVNAATTYANILVEASDVTNGNESGYVQHSVRIAGTSYDVLSLGGYDAGAGTPQAQVVINDGSIDCDFRVESADELNMLFVDAANNRVSIGDSTDAPAATLEITNHATAGATGVPLVQLNSNDTDQIAVDINAVNIDADVIDIRADALTTANVIDVTADGLTTGAILNLVSNSSDTSARTLVAVKNDNTAAVGTVVMHLINDAIGGYDDPILLIESTAAETHPVLELKNSNASTTAEPILMLTRADNSAEADDMSLGQIQFRGVDSANANEYYCQIKAFATDVTATDEGGKMNFICKAGGTAGTAGNMVLLSLGGEDVANSTPCEVIVNESGIDCDFRVESDDNTHMLFVDAGDDTVTIGADDALHKQGFATINDFNGTTFESQLADGEYGSADILRYSPGANDTLTAGQIYFLHTDGTWDATDADAVATGASQMLGVGLGGASQTVGVLTKGFIKIPSTEILNLPGSGACDGLPVYVSTTAGHFDFTAPSATNDFVRIVGYAIDDDSSDVLVYFDPDKTHVVIA